MTTTELIELLKKNERGGATGRPREVMFEVDDRIIDTDGIEVTGSGDGLISELYLSLPSAQQEQKTAHWVPLDERFSWSDYFKCSECGFRIKLKSVTDFGGQSVDCCPHCGAKMEEREMSVLSYPNIAVFAEICKVCGVTVTIKDGEVHINETH